MRKVKILVDSCADLGVDLLEKYGIDYAAMSTVKDGAVSPAKLEWSDGEAHEFYEYMRGGKRITTSQASAEEFHRIFTKYLDEGCDIVYIGCSLKQSGSVNTGEVVAKKLLEGRNDGAEIYCIDSMNASMGEGMLGIEAAKLALSGKSAKEICDYILSVRKNVNEYCTVHTLEHLRRAGRVTASAAFFGNLMGVKPVIIADADGVQAAYKKVRGRQKSLAEIAELLASTIKDSEKQVIYIAHADCPQWEVDFVKDAVESRIPCAEIYVGKIGPIIGASVGPDAVAVFGFGDTVAFSAEKNS